MEQNNVFSRFQELSKGVLDSAAGEAMQPFFEKVGEELKSFENFTELQQAALKDPDFWKAEKNILLQGATSAGKTLIAECSMANQIYARKKNVIYLVPLKALTTEKERTFKAHFEGKKIYSSSADYQDHDYDLIHGNYDIGILVYEKFFALMAQNESSFLKRCGLVVVDEMHMLSDKERGPKLEFAIEMVRIRSRNSLALLGLTTTESDMSAVEKWLDTERTKKIINPSRPVEIEERFLYCDPDSEEPDLECWQNGEQLPEQADFVLYKDIPKNDKDKRFYPLLQVLKNHSGAEEKIIIFCNSKMRCESLMTDICDSGVLEKRSGMAFTDFPDLMTSEMEEKDYNKLRRALLDYGVVYHNSRLGISMRTFIEDTFKKRDGGIRIIISTETLTMGVNMPADIMVLYDHEVYREDDERDVNARPLDYQEYKNAVGRAGRYGITRGNRGLSYVLNANPEDMKKCVITYAHNQEEKKILSGLRITAEDREKYGDKEAFARAAASYYMSVLSHTLFTREELKQLVQGGLERSVAGLSESETLTDEVIDVLCGKKEGSLPLIEESDDDEEEFDESIRYVVKSLGKAFSPFALGIGTYFRMYRRFLEKDQKDPVKPKKNNHHMPVYSEEHAYDISPWPEEGLKKKGKEKNYFFDVMFEICLMPEIKNKHQYVRYDKDKDKENEIKKAILRFFQKHNDPSLYWDNSVLLKYCKDDQDEVQENVVEALYRVIVLYYWVLGKNVCEIREKMGLPDDPKYYIYTSEVQSLGEQCAHQLEAVSKAFESRLSSESTPLRYMFYRLSICVKYGMTGDSARIASRHIRGLTRSKILHMERESKKLGYGSAREFLFCVKPEKTRAFLTAEQDKELRRRLTDPLQYELDRLMDMLEKDAMVDDSFLRKFEACSNSRDAFFELLESMKLDPEKGSSGSLCLRKHGLWIYICTSDKNMESSSDVKRETGYETPEPGTAALILYKKDTLSDKDEDKTCILKDDMDKMILYSVYEAGGRRKAGPYLAALLRRYAEIGRSLLQSGRMKEELDRISESLIKKSLAEAEAEARLAADKTGDAAHIYNYSNNYYINVPDAKAVQVAGAIQNNTQIQIAQYIADYKPFLERRAKEWKKVLKEARDQQSDAGLESDEGSDAFFADVSERITLPAEVTEETLEQAAREILKGYGKSYDEIKAKTEDVDGLPAMLWQALYVERAIQQLKLMEDYSPALTMYNKAIEYCLRKRLRPVFLRDCPKHKMNKIKDKKKLDLEDAPENDFTIGAMAAILRKQHCAEPKPETLTREVDSDERKYWKELNEQIGEATKLRNDSSHPGEEMPVESAEKMRKYAFDIISTTAELPPKVRDAAR